MGKQKHLSPEVGERAIRLVQEHRAGCETQWAAIRSIAERIGCFAESLRGWIRRSARHASLRPGLTTDERERLKRLERQGRELKRANEILRTASACFAAAELDRHMP